MTLSSRPSGLGAFYPETTTRSKSEAPSEPNQTTAKGIFKFVNPPDSQFEAKPKSKADALLDQFNSMLGGPQAQILLGAAKRYTWGADAFKALSEAVAKDELKQQSQSAIEEGSPLNEEAAQRALQRGISHIPTQQSLEELAEEKSGISLSPKTPTEKYLRKAGELASLSPTSGGGVAKSLATRAAAGATGAAAETVAEESGIPAFLSSILGAAVTGSIASGRSAPKALSSEAQSAKVTAEKHNLPKYRGAEIEKVAVRPTISEARAGKVAEELAQASKKAVQNVVDKAIPARELQKQGYDLKEIYEGAYDRAKNMAKSNPIPLNENALFEFMRDEASKIRNSAPSLSLADEAVMKVLEKETKALANAGSLTQEEALNQFQKWNENLKSIYKKPEFAGSEVRVAQTYEKLKQKLIDSIEKSGDKAVADEFRYANKIYSENQKIRRSTELFDEAFADGYSTKALEKALNSRQGAYLMRDLGKDAVNELKDIARYGKIAETRVLDRMKKVPSLMSELSKHNNILGASLLLGGKGAGTILKGAGVVPLVNRLRGYLFTSPSGRKSYINYLKAAATGSETALKRASEKLNESIENEFGSLESFLKYPLKEID